MRKYVEEIVWDKFEYCAVLHALVKISWFSEPCLRIQVHKNQIRIRIQPSKNRQDPDTTHELTCFFYHILVEYIWDMNI